MRIGVLAICMGAVGLTGCDLEDMSMGERFSTEFRYSYPMKAGGSFTLESANGNVEIAGWDQESVEITGVKYARTEALRDQIKIDVSHSPASIAVRTILPFEHNGNMGARYVIRVPRKTMVERVNTTNGQIRLADVEGVARVRTSNGGVQFRHLLGNGEAQTTNGSIDVEDVAGSIHARSSNGRVSVDNARGLVDATTTNGGIRVHGSAKDARMPLRLSTSNGSIDVTVEGPVRDDLHAQTSNGSITLHLARETAARVKARTSSNSIHSDFDMTRVGQNDKHHMEGDIQGGGNVSLDLSTSNGAIRLIKQ